MCEPEPTPLARLGEECAKCLRQEWHEARGPDGCEACRELAYRALCDGNDAAWDLLVTHLWPFILRWLYMTLPELTPTAAESLGYRVMWAFRRNCAERADLATNFPSFATLLNMLYRSLIQVVTPGAE